MKRSPGPWYRTGKYVIRGDDGHIVVRVRAGQTYHPVSGTDEANAVFIEAAPELYEAASCLRSAQRAYMADRGNDELGRAVGRAAERLDEALAKAGNL